MSCSSRLWHVVFGPESTSSCVKVASMFVGGLSFLGVLTTSFPSAHCWFFPKWASDSTNPTVEATNTAGLGALSDGPPSGHRCSCRLTTPGCLSSLFPGRRTSGATMSYAPSTGLRFSPVTDIAPVLIFSWLVTVLASQLPLLWSLVALLWTLGPFSSLSPVCCCATGSPSDESSFGALKRHLIYRTCTTERLVALYSPVFQDKPYSIPHQPGLKAQARGKPSTPSSASTSTLSNFSNDPHQRHTRWLHGLEHPAGRRPVDFRPDLWAKGQHLGFEPVLNQNYII